MRKTFIPLLAVLFIGLKLSSIIDWSWWWVLSPIWITVSLCVILLWSHFQTEIKKQRLRDEMFNEAVNRKLSQCACELRPAICDGKCEYKNKHKSL